MNIKGGKDLPAPEGPINDEYTRNKRSRTEKIVPRVNVNNNNFHKQNTDPLYPSFNNYGTGNSFYGQNMHPSANYGGFNQPGMNQRLNTGIMPGTNQFSGGMMPGMQQIPRMQQMPGMQNLPVMPGMQMPGMGYSSPTPRINYPSFGVPMGFSNSGGIYANTNINIPPSNYSSGYNRNNSLNMNPPPPQKVASGYNRNYSFNMNPPPQNVVGYNRNNNINSLNQYVPYNGDEDDENGSICFIQ